MDLTIDVKDITLGMDTAVPCGLIINELVTNALKHAFSKDRPGKIMIVMRFVEPPAQVGKRTTEGNWYSLSVCDDGKGFPAGVDFRNTDSLGLELVCTLTAQLTGVIDMENREGTRFTIVFKEMGGAST